MESDREYVGAPERLPPWIRVVRKLPTRMAQSAWNRLCPRLEMAGTTTTSSSSSSPPPPGLDARWRRTIAQGGERGDDDIRDPDLRNPGDGGIYAVSNEWLLLHPPEGQWAHLAGAAEDPKGACVRYEAGAICIDPDVATALRGGGFVCYIVLTEVPDGHLRPVTRALYLFDVRDVVAALSVTSRARSMIVSLWASESWTKRNRRSVA